MKDIYKLAIALKIPIVLTEEWAEANRLWAYSRMFRIVGSSLYDKDYKQKSEQELKKSDMLHSEGLNLYIDAVRKEFGEKALIDWDNGEITLRS